MPATSKAPNYTFTLILLSLSALLTQAFKYSAQAGAAGSGGWSSSGNHGQNGQAGTVTLNGKTVQTEIVGQDGQDGQDGENGETGEDGQDGQSVVVSSFGNRNGVRCVCKLPSFSNNFQIVWGRYVTVEDRRSCECMAKIEVPSIEPEMAEDKNEIEKISNPEFGNLRTAGFVNMFANSAYGNLGNFFAWRQPEVCACQRGGRSACCCRNTCGNRCGWYFRCGQGCGC